MSHPEHRPDDSIGHSIGPEHQNKKYILISIKTTSIWCVVALSQLQIEINNSRSESFWRRHRVDEGVILRLFYGCSTVVHEGWQKCVRNGPTHRQSCDRTERVWLSWNSSVNCHTLPSMSATPNGLRSAGEYLPTGLDDPASNHASVTASDCTHQSEFNEGMGRREGEYQACMGSTKHAWAGAKGRHTTAGRHGTAKRGLRTPKKAVKARVQNMYSGPGMATPDCSCG